MRLFYARPDYVPHTTKIIAGLPLKRVVFIIISLLRRYSRFTPLDILNIMNPLSLSKRGDQKQELPYELPDPRKQMDNARLLSKYVFPRQYGLASVFTLDPWIVQNQQPTYADRTDEVKVCCYVGSSIARFSYSCSAFVEKRAMQNANTGEARPGLIGKDDLDEREV